MEGIAVPPDDQDKIMHVSLPIGRRRHHDGERHPPGVRPGTDAGQQCLHLGSVDEQGGGRPDLHPLSDGGQVEMSIADQPWREYFGSFKDKFGVMWMVNYGTPQEG